ncbi:MAG: O-methyltransferase [Erysipelotrichaceae bacterium]|nr:O-methyltransferase [Erysipelotrichaceae bacterium]
MDVIKEMEAYAKANSVPIMEEAGLSVLCELIQRENIRRILEIGTAIGYSAIRMALVHEDIEVVSIERDAQRYAQAVQNVHKANMAQRITLIHEDALYAQVNGSFDLLFVDAAKAQYRKFFDRYTPYLNVGGYVVSDNLNFHGFVSHPEIIRSRHLKQMVRKISGYIEFLQNNEDYTSEFINVGDGLAISRKKSEK